VKKLAVVFATLLVVLPDSTKVSADQPPQYFVNEALLPFDALPGTTTTRLWGVHGGAGYRIEVPENWNGELVVYAHGFRGIGLELTVSNPAIRSYLIANGYAWAASSYSKNGYDVKEGVKDTLALTMQFNGLVGTPTRRYLIGHSMGGHITGVAIEQYPNVYDGAGPMCGVMGDAELFDYFLDFHMVAQALTGIHAPYPYELNYQPVVVPMLKAALGSPYPSALNAAGMKLRAVTEQISGGTRPGFPFAFDVAWGNFLFNQSTVETVGVAPGRVMGNLETVYQLDGDPALNADEQALNLEVQRIAPDPQGLHPNGLANIPRVNGTITIPTLSMHTLGDLFVPFSMEQIYKRRADENGASDLLVQRAYRHPGHCSFTVLEQEQAFEALADWVKLGVKPAGDDVITPSIVAAPTYGCTFSQPGVVRPGFSACP
jgi:pimeloyl-ACP methyl ester carboxylesterase